MAEINYDNITNLAEMYAIFFSAAYKRLVADGVPEKVASQIALQMLHDHIQSSIELATKKNKIMQDLLAGNVKGGSA